MIAAPYQTTANILPKDVVFERERIRFNLGIPALGLLIIYVLIAVAFPPRPLSGGVPFAAWVAVILGASGLSLLVSFGIYIAFERARFASNLVFCGLMIVKLFTMCCLMAAMPEIEARRAELQESRRTGLPATSTNPAMSALRNAAPRPGTPAGVRPANKPPPIVKVRPKTAG